jgi:hypothetical protein
MTHNMVSKRKANEFVIWRAATSVNWDCTIAELAAETGLTSNTVRKAALRKGWELVGGHVDRTQRASYENGDVLAQMRVLKR